jgi:hypothetical protein
VAILFVTGPGSPEYPEDKLMTPRWKESVGGSGILALHLKHRVAEAMLSRAGIDLSAWAATVIRASSRSNLPVPARGATVSVKKDRRTTANVVGILRGTDPAAGVIVLGGHYDHLGLGNESSLAPSQIGQIHNGADDNASGTAGVVELARVFSQSERVRRTLVFVAFSGEEVGLLGSQYFVEKSPPFPLETIQAMLNMDMIGRPRASVSSWETGSSPPSPPCSSTRPETIVKIEPSAWLAPATTSSSI